MRAGSMLGLVIAGLIAFASLGGCDSANVQGAVVDDFGTPLDGVDVSITNTELRTKTDSRGRYKLGYVPGRFEVRFQKEGYEPVSIWLELATRESVPVSSQTLPSKKAREAVIGAFAKTIDFLHARYLEHYRAKGQLTAHVQKELENARLEFLTNIGKAKFGRAFMSHVMAFPTGSTLVMTNAAYIRLGFEPLLSFDGADRIEIPPDARAYFDRVTKCDQTIVQAMDGMIGVDHPEFQAAAEACYLTYGGAAITAAQVLAGAATNLSDDKGSVSDIRKMVADERAKKSSR